MKQGEVIPAPGIEPATPRERRILMVSELFPEESHIGFAVFGSYQRLRRHLEAVNELGRVDAIFVWHANFDISKEEVEAMRVRIQPHWPISGEITVVGAAFGRSRRSIETALWTLRGGVSFTYFPEFTIFEESQAVKVREAIRACQPDLIFAHRLGAMGLLIRSRERLPPVVLDIDDMEHVRVARMAIDGTRLWPVVRRRALLEIARLTTCIATERASVSLLCSEHDRKILSDMVPGARFEVLSNATRTVDFYPPASTPTALFIGLAHYPPNAEAIHSLIREIWPRVRRLVPTAELTIIGQGALTIAGSDPENGINVFDFEADLSGFYRNARIAVCPIQSGGGTRVKIIEAAVYGRPVVSTTIGAEGLSFTPGSEILIADGPDAFAQACAGLFLDGSRCEQIGLAARKRAMDEYSHERIVARLSGILTGVLEGETADGRLRR